MSKETPFRQTRDGTLGTLFSSDGSLVEDETIDGSLDVVFTVVIGDASLVVAVSEFPARTRGRARAISLEDVPTGETGNVSLDEVSFDDEL